MHQAWRLAILTGVWALVVLLPGPDFVATAHSAASRSRRSSLGVVTGIGVGATIWVVSAIAGVDLLLAHARWVIEAVRVGGAVFLASLGVRSILRCRGQEDRPTKLRTRQAPFLTGLLTDLANPKAAVFWTSLFAALLPRHGSLAFEAASVVVVVVVAVSWYATVAFAFSSGFISGRYKRAQHAIDRATGGVYLVLSGLLLADH